MKYKLNMTIILVRGSGDVGSAVAHLLFRSGLAVVLHEELQPSATRRLMAFTDAVFNGTASLEGVEARRVEDPGALEDALKEHSFIPLVAGDFDYLLRFLHPDVLVDARMRKHSQPKLQRGLAPLTIGLGPNFIAGESVDLAVETGRGENLGRVIRAGSTEPLQGEPVELGGHARERYVYATIGGVFHTTCRLGQIVSQGEVVANIDGSPLAAPLSGALRGLTHDGVPVTPGTKVIEIDPRGPQAQVSGIAARPERIARGVLEALQSHIE